MPQVKQATAQVVLEAAQQLAQGQLVAMPTETVYGLAADATNAQAVASIFATKNRPQFNPLIAHVASLADAEKLVQFDARARSVAQAFWPGPITLVLPQQPSNGVADLVSAGLPTLAVRVPQHPVALQLLQAFGKPLAAPSANISGHVSPTQALHVATEFAAYPDLLVLAGGAAQVGLESTILDLSGDTPKILRAGAVTQQDLEQLLGCEVWQGAVQNDSTPNAPGQLTRHYATTTPLRLNAVDVQAGEALLAFGSLKFMGADGVGFAKDLPQSMLCNLSADSDLQEAAANLFAMLRVLDVSGAYQIAVMPVPNQGLGVAINDRLKRAAVAAV